MEKTRNIALRKILGRRIPCIGDGRGFVMAQMIPDSLPASKPAGERRVFNALAQLADDCLVYYEPVVRRRYPDIIVILPEVGLLVIEVKDWRLSELVSADSHSVVVNRSGKESVGAHPSRQARDYMYRLMDECRKHSRTSTLMRADGRYANRFAFPFCHVAVLNNITRIQIETSTKGLADIFPRPTTITREKLGEWEALGPKELAARLKSYFEPWWPFPKMTPSQVDVLRSVIHPHIVIKATDTDLAVLDLRQERNARAIGDGHRIVYGVAGSGKTVLLIARAKLLSEDPGKRILMLCCNRLLASHLAMSLRNCGKVKVLTFHGWGRRNGIEFSPEESDEAFGQRLLVKLQSGSGDRGRFDAVLIDEAQDWPCSWFQCAKLALREPETGDLLIVGDGSQSLYRARTFSWKDAGVHAAGRTINKAFDLDRNYRNTAEILRAARLFAVKPSMGSTNEISVLALPVDPDAAIRSGPEPLIVRLDNALDECNYAAALIETWLRGGIEINGRRERVRASDVAILYPWQQPDAALLKLCERLNSFAPAVVLDRKTPRGTLWADSIKVLTMASSRGLQFRIVVLLWAGALPSQFKTRANGADRSLLYVAMTRAEDMLVILHSGHSAYRRTQFQL